MPWNSNSVSKSVDPRTMAKAKTTILGEEEYLSQMGDIIERDFFPDLLENRLLEKALHDNIGHQFGQAGESPATFETPVAQSNSELSSRASETMEVSKMIVHESLTDFFRKYQSQDNVNFNEQLKKAEEKHKLTHAWMYKSDNTSTDNHLVVPSIEEQAKGFKRPFELDTWPSKAENQLMFAPTVAPPKKENLLELIDQKQTIIHANTSLRGMPFNEQRSQAQIQQMALNQARNMEGKIGVDGKVVTFQTPSAFTPLTPSPRPGVSESPLMTYGQVEGTPCRLEPSTPHPSNAGHGFSMQPLSKRERIAHELDKAAIMKQKARKNTPSPLITHHKKNSWTGHDSPKKRFLKDIMSRERLGKPPSPWVIEQVGNIFNDPLRMKPDTPSPARLGLIVRPSSSLRKCDSIRTIQDDLTHDLPINLNTTRRLPHKPQK